MSPGQALDQVDEDKQILALAKGFNALLETARKLTTQERELQKKLQFAHDEVGFLSSLSSLFLSVRSFPLGFSFSCLFV